MMQSLVTTSVLFSYVHFMSTDEESSTEGAPSSVLFHWEANGMRYSSWEAEDHRQVDAVIPTTEVNTE